VGVAACIERRGLVDLEELAWLKKKRQQRK
jgi:hypothetical protein